MKREFHIHGNASDPTYSKYQAMIQRCGNPKHKRFLDYGGRGITLCVCWKKSFSNFLADLGIAPDGISIE
jgi:hypothetical protein